MLVYLELIKKIDSKGEQMKTLDKVMTVIEDWCGRMAERLF